MEAATVIAWRPLGEMLVARGLLTLPELDDALDEQERTGDRLGMILVARKIVPGAVLTTILAEQLGVELETQGGFGSGLFTKIARQNGSGDKHAAGEPAPALAAVTNVEPPTEPPRVFVDEVLAELDRVRQELDVARTRCTQLEADLRKVKVAARAKVISKKPKAAPKKPKAVARPKAPTRKAPTSRASKSTTPAKAKPRTPKRKPPAR